MKHRISAGALVVHQNRILLVRYAGTGSPDYWVAPGGGVDHREELMAAARREAFEEANIDIEPYKLAYIEELTCPDSRICKFWFAARYLSGDASAHRPEAKKEGIAEARWLARDELAGKHVFPSVLNDRFWSDLEAGFPAIGHFGPREMLFE